MDPKIEAHSCSTQYGNPSGHSFTALATALTIWLDYYDSMKAEKYNGSFLGRWYVSLAFLVLAVGFSFTIGFSRIVMGVHTWNQLLFGW